MSPYMPKGGLKRLLALVEETPHLLVAIAIFYALPFMVPTLYWVRILSMAFVLALFALAYDVALGLTGLPSFGHAAIFGMGAYALVWSLRLGLPLPVAIMASLVMGVALGALMASFLKQVKEIYYAMVTLAMAEIMHMLMDKAVRISGGFTGLRVPMPDSLYSPGVLTAHLALSSIMLIMCIVIAFRKMKVERSGTALVYLILTASMLLALLMAFPALAYKAFYTPVYRLVFALYFVSFTALWISYVLLRRMANSTFGSVLVGIRENEERMLALGYDTAKYKMFSMLISGLFTGLAGGLFALVSLTPVRPDLLGAEYTIEVLLYSILGGLGTLVGPMVGAGIVTFLDMRLRPFLGAYWLLFMGVFYVLIMLFLPFGIVGTLFYKRVSARRLFLKLLRSLRRPEHG